MSRRFGRIPLPLIPVRRQFSPALSLSISNNRNPLGGVHGSSTRTLSMSGARLRKHADYQRVYAASRKRQSASMSWFLAPQSEPVPKPICGLIPGPRVGLTAGKVLGKAHERNRIKRRMRDILRRHVDLLPVGFDLVLHPRRSVLTAEFSKLEAEVVRILGQANAEAARIAQPAAPKPIV
jgi:ribonuclease P protein component